MRNLYIVLVRWDWKVTPFTVSICQFQKSCWCGSELSALSFSECPEISKAANIHFTLAQTPLWYHIKKARIYEEMQCHLVVLAVGLYWILMAISVLLCSGPRGDLRNQGCVSKLKIHLW